MTTESMDEQETICKDNEAILENYSQSEDAIYHNTATNDPAGSQISEDDLLPRPRSACEELSDDESNLSVNLSKHCISSEWQSKEHRDRIDFLSINADQRTEKKKVCPTRANLPLSKRPSKLAPHKKGKRRHKQRPYCKKSRRRHRVKRTRKTTNVAENQVSSSTDQVPSHSSKAPLKHFSSPMYTSKDVGTDNRSNCSPNTRDTEHKSQRSGQESYGMLRNENCCHAYSDNTPVNKKRPTANEATTAYIMTSGKLHGQATVKQDMHPPDNEEVHHSTSTEQGIHVMGKSNEQESDEVIDYRVSAVCLGEGTKSTSEDERQEMQRQVNQPIQATSQDWEIPVVVHAGLVHYQNIVIEQPSDEESTYEPPSFPYPVEEQDEDQSSSEIVLINPPRPSLRRNFSTPMPPTLPLPTSEQPASSHESLIQMRQVSVAILTNQGVHLIGVLVENAVSYCSVSRPSCRTNYDITCRLRTTLHQARVRLLLVEFRFNRVRRRILTSPCQIDCVLLRQVHCHVRQIVHEVQVTHDRYCRSQIQFQHIQGMILHSNCRLQHTEHLHQLRRSCCVQICRRLENTNRLLDRVGHLLLTILCQLQRPNIMAVAPLPFHNPRQAADHPAFLVGPENVQPFQVQTEEQIRDLVSEK